PDSASQELEYGFKPCHHTTPYLPFLCIHLHTPLKIKLHLNSIYLKTNVPRNRKAGSTSH
ncbi:hypothetical protein ACQP3J_30480, partial [Escherichia coli]